MKRREWWIGKYGSVYTHPAQSDEPLTHVISANYCESLEREVKALRDGLAPVSMGAVNDVDEAVSEVCKAILSADRFRDEREKL